VIKKIKKPEVEWKKLLTPEQYAVMRQKGTERPFTCEIKKRNDSGVFHCAACHLPLFRAAAKFESGTGWPSFYEPIARANLIFEEDSSHGMARTEVLCAQCESHPVPR
jgi:peptide-methionine (R)-S-oxide reductase